MPKSIFSRRLTRVDPTNAANLIGRAAISIRQCRAGRVNFLEPGLKRSEFTHLVCSQYIGEKPQLWGFEQSRPAELNR